MSYETCSGGLAGNGACGDNTNMLAPVFRVPSQGFPQQAGGSGLRGRSYIEGNGPGGTRSFPDGTPLMPEHWWNLI